MAYQKLLGPREEKRSGEDAAKAFYKYFGFLIPSKYKGIDASQVAKAMLSLAAKDTKGRFVYESRALHSFQE